MGLESVRYPVTDMEFEWAHAPRLINLQTSRDHNGGTYGVAKLATPYNMPVTFSLHQRLVRSLNQ